MKRILKITIIAVLIIFLLVVIIGGVNKYNEHRAKYNEVIIYDTVEEYYYDYVHTWQYDTEILDDILYSVYINGYKQEFLELYNQEIGTCEVDCTYSPINDSEIKSAYLLMFDSLQGDIKYLYTDLYGDEVIEYEFGTQTKYTCKLNYCSGKAIANSYNDIDNIFKKDVDEKDLENKDYYKTTFYDTTFDIYTIKNDGTATKGVNMIPTYQLYEIDALANNVYDYIYGNEYEKKKALEYLSQYYPNKDVEESIDTYLNLIKTNESGDGRDVIKGYVESGVNENAKLDVNDITEQYPTYKDFYDITANMCKLN